MSETAALPDLDAPYPLSKDQVDAYQTNGHITLHQVATAEEVGAYRRVINEAVERLNTERRSLDERDTYGKAFLQIINLWVNDEAVKRFVFAKRFAGIAAQLLGVEGVRLYHDQALFKEPHGGHTPWHQDQFYWPLDTDKTITLWMPLVDADESMGVMQFASGSQSEGFLGHIGISDESEATFKQFVADKGFALTSAGSLAAGDATFHNGWTLHCAPANQTDRMREAMTVIYFADGARCTEPDNPNRERDLAEWLTGCQPGDLAAGPLNPLIYP